VSNRVQHDGNESNVIPNLFRDLMERSSKVTDAEIEDSRTLIQKIKMNSE